MKTGVTERNQNRSGGVACNQAGGKWQGVMKSGGKQAGRRGVGSIAVAWHGSSSRLLGVTSGMKISAAMGQAYISGQ